MGMFPAAALMFRRGDVKRGEPAVQERRAESDIWARQSPLIPEQAALTQTATPDRLPLPRRRRKTGTSRRSPT
ncbi:MAG: hypothetical protein R3F11_11065 [Verrucomicrobiales bacterium]